MIDSSDCVSLCLAFASLGCTKAPQHTPIPPPHSTTLSPCPLSPGPLSPRPGYMAAKSSSDECKMLALCSGATAFIAYTLNNAYRVMNKGSTQATIDLAAGIGLLTVCTAALLK